MRLHRSPATRLASPTFCTSCPTTTRQPASDVTAVVSRIFFYGRKLDDSWFYNPQKVDTTEPYWELYDLRSDPKEMNNVINDPQYAATFKTLKDQIYELKVETGDTDQKFPEVKELFDTVLPMSMR